MTAAGAALSSAVPPPRLAARGLERRFGARAALAGASFEVAPGEVLGLLGPNGAGKTTAFRVLAGLIPADGGEVELDGRAVAPTSRAYRARLGVVFQEPSLDLKLTGRENLRLGAVLYGVPRAVATARIEAALRLMDLGARADEPAARYSGGMRRRIEIARVLLHEPALVLLDEPGRGVDPEALRRIWDEIGAQTAARGMSVIVTTHQPEEAARCQRIALLDGGAVVAAGTPDELRARVAGDVVRVRGARPAEIAAVVRERLGLEARVSDGAAGSAGDAAAEREAASEDDREGEVTIEAPRGAALIPRVAELFPAGRLASLATSRPTLADVFAKLTGRRLAA